MLAGGGCRGDEQRAGAVIDAGGIACRNREFRPVDALEPGQLLQRGVGARMLVGVENLQRLDIGPQVGRW